MHPGLAGTGVAVDGSTHIDHWKVYTQSVDFASVAANVVAEQDITVTGVAVGDIVLAVHPNAALSVALGIAGARVKSANTIAVKLVNPTAGALDPDALSVSFFVIRPA